MASRLSRMLLCTLIAATMAACGDDTVPVSIGGYNHIPNRAILSFSVDIQVERTSLPKVAKQGACAVRHFQGDGTLA